MKRPTKVHAAASPFWARLIAWVGLVVASYFAAQLLIGLSISVLLQMGISWQVESTMSLLVIRIVLYGLMLAGIAGFIWYREKTLDWRGEAGLERLLNWRDTGLGFAGVVVYLAATILTLIILRTIPGFDVTQVQDLGLHHLYGGDLLSAFFVLVVLTPFLEEMIFRGFLYGRLRRISRLPWWVSALVVSVLFGVAHMQWNVGVDVFCLSMVACALREMTGTIWAGTLLHVTKNLLAFLATFVFAPDFFH